MRQLIAGNWKMNGLGASLSEITALASELRTAPPPCDVLICPPATLVARAVALNSGIAIGGQDCHAEASGAFTGDISAGCVLFEPTSSPVQSEVSPRSGLPRNLEP